MPKNTKKTPLSLVQGLVILVIGIIVGGQVQALYGGDSPSALNLDPANIVEHDLELEQLWDVYGKIKEKYYGAESVSKKQLEYGIVKGMVDALDDPYSGFMDPEESEAFQTSLNGELQGIGAELTVRDGRLVVVSPLKDSPAQREGLLPADHIFMVDGAPTADMTLWDAIMAIRGEKGTQVVLTVLRENVDEAIDITITREDIFVPSIEHSVVEQEGKMIGVVSIYQFSDDTYAEFKSALRQLRLEGIEALVLDMRGNGGGFLDISVEMLGELFEEEKKAVVVRRRGQENRILYTQGDGAMPELPLAVLINEGSASASEIVAGAIQDYERGVLIGAQTFGKGSVQELIDLKNGASLRVTVAKWFTPEDRTIDQVGITPDILVDMPAAQIDTEDDTQMQAALDYLSR